MSKLVNGTAYVLGDEKAYGLYELNYQSPNNKGFHRYQIILVNRDGKLAEWRLDMGSEKKFKGVKQLRIPSLWEHTVDELKDLADDLRYETRLDLKELCQLDKMNLV